jgi:uncharacterized protein (UPF0248 family)
MIPLHELLNRIRWDAEFGRASFDLGYYDRVADELRFVPFERLTFTRTDDETFSIVDDEGIRRSIPFHRVKRVVRNGQVIWSRDR